MLSYLLAIWRGILAEFAILNSDSGEITEAQHDALEQCPWR